MSHALREGVGHRVTPKRAPAVPNGVVGMLAFLLTEMMFFAGLGSAYVIAEGAADSGWPPPSQPRLPVEMSAMNTVALLLSGLILIWAARRFKEGPALARVPLLAAIGFGSLFVVVQGIEVVELIAQGLTLTFSTHSAFFYLIVGLHALHATTALLILIWAARRLSKGVLTSTPFWTARLLWYFVVLIWPILYMKVYS